MSRKILAVAVIVAVVLSSAVGWVVGSRIRSPAELASRTAPPPAAPILVPVESRVLSSAVVTRGTARFGSPQQVILAPSAIKPGPGIIDSLPLVGAELTEGGVALTASGRPVMVLQGSRPSYRDLGPGLEGTDVRQLEEALARLGFDPGPVDGMYDERTGLAVAAWYGANAFTPASASAAQLAGIRTIETALATARFDLLKADQSVVSAQSALATAQGSERVASLDAQNATSGVTAAGQEARKANEAAAADASAKQAVLDRVRAGTSPQRPAPHEIKAAEADLQNALATAQSARAAGERAIADARALLELAPAALARAKATAEAANRAADADVAAKQALHDERSAKGATAAELAAAYADLQNALVNAQSVRAANERAVADAQAVVGGAPGALASAEREAASRNQAAQADAAAKQSALDGVAAGKPAQPPAAADLVVAEADLRTAQLNAETVRLTGDRLVADAKARVAIAASNVGGSATAAALAQAALDLARKEAADRIAPRDSIESDLGLSQRRAGIQVPADEIVFVRSMPVRVSELKLKRSDPATGPVMSFTDTSVSIDGSLALDGASLVQPGMNVRIDEPDLGISATGVVQTVAATPGTNGVDGFHVYFATRVDKPPPNLVGASVRLTIAVESTGGGAALVVPVNAVSLAPDGSSRVERDKNGTLETVTVEPGLSASGFVAVRPVKGSLTVGDLVEVGVVAATNSNVARTPGSTPSG